MTDSYRKRKYAGPTVQERRQLDQDPARHNNKPKPREYVLTTYEERRYVYKHVSRYATRAAREQAKLAAQKQAAAANVSRLKYYDEFEQKVWFEEAECVNTQKVRTALFLYAWQIEQLRHVSAKAGAPVSEIIRRAIAIYLQKLQEKSGAK